MSRMAELRARRERLLARCAEQRAELGGYIERLRPGRSGDASPGERHPLGWIAVLGGLMLVTRARELLSLLMFARSAVTLVSRALQLLRLGGRGGATSSAGAAASAARAAAGRAGRA